MQRLKQLKLRFVYVLKTIVLLFQLEEVLNLNFDFAAR